MPAYAQIVVGPAGSGKSTYCHMMQQHFQVLGRSCRVINLDPAAETYKYEATVDIRELISIEDVMDDEELHLGPNGGLVFCMEYLTENFEWLHENMDPQDDDYYIIDCPGQIELYTHLDVMKVFVDKLKSWDFRVGAVYLMDSQFLVERGKYISGTMAALSCMTKLEVPHMNIMTKIDVLSPSAREEIDNYTDPSCYERVENATKYTKRYAKLVDSLFRVIDDYSLVNFHPLDSSDEDSINYALAIIDTMLQWGEDQDVKVRDEEERDFENEMDELNLND